MKTIGQGPGLRSCSARRSEAFHRWSGKKPGPREEIVRVAELPKDFDTGGAARLTGGVQDRRRSRILPITGPFAGGITNPAVLGRSLNSAMPEKGQDIFRAYGRRSLDRPVSSNKSARF